MKKAIVLMAIGKKYRAQLNASIEMFSSYAEKCNSELKIIDCAPDPSFSRPLLAQKLLIPSLLLGYDVCAFLDLDILINPTAESILDELDNSKSFGAVLDPRGSKKFNNTWGLGRSGKQETTEQYFLRRGFAPDLNTEGSINGGIFLFRPIVVHKAFSEYYYSSHSQGAFESYEEAPMAFISQNAGWFQALDDRWNRQLIYEIKGTLQGRMLPKISSRVYRRVAGLFPSVSSRHFVSGGFLREPYVRYLKCQLAHCSILHFAGKYPIVTN